MSMLILSTAVGYGDPHGSTFVQSLGKTGYEGDAILLTDIGKSTLPPHTARRFAEREFIKNSKKKYDKIVVSDFRDVLFQRNPLYIDVNKLDVFLEWEGVTINEEEYNRSWILRDYGEELLSRIGRKPVSCCGVVSGTHNGMVEYFDYICSQIETRGMDQLGADTSAHLKYVWEDGNPTIHENEYGPVYTVGLVPSIRIQKGTILNNTLNNGGNIPTIVHQYDRHLGDF